MTQVANLSTESIERLCHRYGVVELALFGSATRKDFGPESDYDFLVVFANDDYGPWMSKLTDLERDLADLLGRRVEVVPKKDLKWVIRDEVLREARVLYEAA